MVIPKISQNQQLDINLVKPISNTELLTGGQKIDSYVSFTIHKTELQIQLSSATMSVLTFYPYQIHILSFFISFY